MAKKKKKQKKFFRGKRTPISAMLAGNTPSENKGSTAGNS